MFGLFVSLFLLGVSAVDPVGIAAMPILLTHNKPLLRSGLFLFGSFAALMIMGLAFAQGVGLVVRRFEMTYEWLLPAIEILAALALLLLAFISARHMKLHDEKPRLPKFMMQGLQLKGWHLFLLGALLVIVQSLVDVVFVIAMIHVEQLHLSLSLLVLSVATYAVAALLLQLAVVLAYQLAPPIRRAAVLHRVNQLTQRYASRTLIAISLVFGGGLLLDSLLALTHYPHF